MGSSEMASAVAPAAVGRSGSGRLWVWGVAGSMAPTSVVLPSGLTSHRAGMLSSIAIWRVGATCSAPVVGS